MELLKQFKGYSGSEVSLFRHNETLFVRKINNVVRNAERLDFLYKKGYNVPKIYSCNETILDMEYIHGLDMRNYLKSHDVTKLCSFLNGLFFNFSFDSEIQPFKDYTETYHKKLEWLNDSFGFPFTKEELIDRLPKLLPQTTYHGDLTLDNIIHNNDKFYMIDAITSEYDSYIFDIAKLRQDLECKWFIRNYDLKIDVKLKNLQDDIMEYCPRANDDNLLILMLLRVYPYVDVNDKNYILKEIKRLWK